MILKNTYIIYEHRSNLTERIIFDYSHDFFFIFLHNERM